MPEKEVKIKEGSVIRFGRIPFKVSKIELPQSSITAEQKKYKIYEQDEDSKSSEEENCSGEVKKPEELDSETDVISFLKKIGADLTNNRIQQQS